MTAAVENHDDLEATDCTQTSVKFARKDGIETEQALHYGSREWHEIYEHDRNSIESIDAYLKTGPERMDESAGRRVRGLAAQSYIFTIMMVTTNLRRIAKFMNTSRKAQPKTPPIQRSGDRNNLTGYRRWYDWVDAVLEEDLPPPESTTALRTERVRCILTLHLARPDNLPCPKGAAFVVPSLRLARTNVWRPEYSLQDGRH